MLKKILTTKGLFKPTGFRALESFPASQSKRFSSTTTTLHDLESSSPSARMLDFKTNSSLNPKFFSTLRIKTLPASCEAPLETLVGLLNLQTKDPFDKVMMVAVQHILGTTVDMFRVFKKLGLKRAIIGGKSYSSHRESIEELKKLDYTFIEAPPQLGYGRFDACMQETVNNIWHTALEAMKEKSAEILIVLDDGGDLLGATPAILFNGIPYKPKCVVGIEQTKGGANQPCFNGLPFSIINVAGSYIKNKIEYPSVAELAAIKVIEDVEQKIGPEFREKLPTIGVVGYGTMGKAVAASFRKKGYRVLVHDDNPTQYTEERRYWRPTVPILISEANIIIGCTGTDITAKTHTLETILNSLTPKFYVSTSSKDVEFNRLLIHIQQKTKQFEKTPNPLTDIEYLEDAEGGKIVILKGGFPVNFNNQKHSVSPEKIWPTRAALMSACLMAAEGYKKKLLNTAKVLKLDAHSQQLILKMYAEMNPENANIFRLYQG